MSQNPAYKGSVYAAEILVKCERIIGPVYEVARQDNGITDVLIKNGNGVFHTSRDFLEYECHFPNVITEPLVGKAQDWAFRAMEIADDKTAFLLPLKFLESTQAKEVFDKTPLARIYVLPKSLPVRRGRYAWFVWQKGHFDSAILKYL